MNKTRRLLAKQLIGVCAILFLTFKAIATDVVFDLSAFGASPTTNRTVTLQTLSPFPGNLRFFTSDSNGMFTFTNAPASLYQGYIKAPPAQIPFKILVTATNLGAVAADTITVADSTATFPAGAVAWSALTSDSRYARDTNFVITGFQPAAANLTNWTGAQTNQYQRTNPVISSLISVGVFATNTLLAGANISLSTNSSGVVTITSSGGGSATNAIGNFNGFGTNTTVVTNFTATNITGSVAAFSIINTPNLVGIDIGANGTNDPGSIGSVVIASAGSAIQRAGVGHAAIVAGQNNRIGAGPNATGSVILGGSVNIISNQSSIIAGGANNFIGGSHSFLAGGDNIIVAGDDSVGLGSKATANHNNTFIWNDGSATFASTAIQEFLVQAAGGMAVNTNNPGTNALYVNGNIMAKSFSIPGNQVPFVENPTNTGTSGQVLSLTGGDTKWVDQTGSGGSTSVTPGNSLISMLTNGGTVSIFAANQTNVYAQTRWTTNNDTSQINGRNVTNVIAFGVSSAVTNQWRTDFTNATINVDNLTIITNNDADTFKVNTNFVVVTNSPRAMSLTNANNIFGGSMTNGANVGRAFSSHPNSISTSEQFGENSSSSAARSVNVGTESGSLSPDTVSIGYSTKVSATKGIAIGSTTTNGGLNTIIVGAVSKASGQDTIIVGTGSDSGATTNTILIGNGISSTLFNNRIVIGLANQNVVFPGNASFVSNATVTGNATFSGNAAFSGDISNRTSVITNLNIGANVAMRESTNVVSVKGAGSTFVNGLFRRQNGLCLTNFNGVLLTNISGVNYLQSNNVTMYSSATLDNATWTQVSGVLAVPSSTLGVEMDADQILPNGTLVLTNAQGRFVGTFIGNGSGLTNVAFAGNGAAITNSTDLPAVRVVRSSGITNNIYALTDAARGAALTNAWLSASNGDTLYLSSGTFLVTTNPTFSKAVTIVGEGTNLTTIKFQDAIGTVTVSADLTLKNLTLRFDEFAHNLKIQNPCTNFSMSDCFLSTPGSLFQMVLYHTNTFHFSALRSWVTAGNDIFYTANQLGGPNQTFLIDGGEWQLPTVVNNPIFIGGVPWDGNSCGSWDLRNMRFVSTGATNVQWFTYASPYFTNGSFKVQNVSCYFTFNTTPPPASFEGPDKSINRLLELIGTNKVFVQNLTFVSNNAATYRIDVPDLFETAMFQSQGMFPVLRSNTIAYYLTGAGSTEANGFYIFKNTSGTASYFTNTLGNGSKLVKDSNSAYVGGPSLQITNDTTGSLFYTISLSPTLEWSQDTGTLPAPTGSYAHTNASNLKLLPGTTTIDNNLALIGTVTTDFSFATNALSTWPVSPKTPGGASIVNSNGTIYILTSLASGTTWAATNKIAP